MFKKGLLIISFFALSSMLVSSLSASITSDYDVTPVTDLTTLLRELGCNDTDLLTVLNTQKCLENSCSETVVDAFINLVQSCYHNSSTCLDNALEFSKTHSKDLFLVSMGLLLTCHVGSQFGPRVWRQLTALFAANTTKKTN